MWVVYFSNLRYRSSICKYIFMCIDVVVLFQGSADSNYSQPSSELSLDEDKEALRREKEAQALSQLDKARVSSMTII